MVDKSEIVPSQPIDNFNDEDNSKKKKEKVETVGFLELFSFSDKLDVILLCLGMVASVVAGSIFPILFIVFGNISNGFTDYQVKER